MFVFHICPASPYQRIPHTDGFDFRVIGAGHWLFKRKVEIEVQITNAGNETKVLVDWQELTVSNQSAQ